jgi:hypothetical protein
MNSKFLPLIKVNFALSLFLVILILYLNIDYVSAQKKEALFSNFTSLKRVISLNRAFNPSEIYNVKFATNSQQLRFTHYEAKNNTDSVWIYNLNLENFVLDSTIYVIKNLSKYLQDNYSKSLSYIAFNHRWTVIGVYGLMYVFDDKNVLYKKIEMKDPLKFVKFIDDNQLLCAWIFNTKNKQIKPSALNLFDVEKATYVKSIYPNFDVLPYSQVAPNHFFDATEKSILFSQTVDYKIDIYNRDFIAIDSIRCKPNAWQRLSKGVQDEIIKKRLTGVDAIYKIIPYEKTTSRLHQVYLINDSTILTNYSVPNLDSSKTQPDFAFDIWRKSSSGWQLLHQNLVDKFSDEDLITASNYPLFEDKLLNIMAFSKDYLITLVPFAPINPIGLSKKAYKQQCDEYLLDNSPQLILYIYSLKLN